jgi:Tol biopolymer transport system component
LAERSNIQARLNAGIEAARSGDQTTARKLLQQVISADPNNEVAWMWMASAVTSVSERRACLEKALSINPNNARAQEALKRLDSTANEKERAREAVDLRVTEARRAKRQAETGTNRGITSNPYLLMATIVLVLVVGIILYTLASAPPPASNVVSPTEVADAGLVSGTEDAAASNVTATPVPLSGEVVPFDVNAIVTLPPTFTPTFTPTASDTPTPTVTPIPLSSFLLAYSSTGSGAGVFGIRADGSEERDLGASGDGPLDIAVDPNGRQIAFVLGESAPSDSDSTEEPNNAPQLYVAPVGDVGVAVAITEMTGSILRHPTWSGDGTKIAFTSNDDGDEEIWVINADGTSPVNITHNDATDRDPAWSPDGRLIAFASDRDSPPSGAVAGSPEIYLMTPDGSLPERLTDAAHDSYSPAWSPDSLNIVFVSTRGDDPDLYIMDAQGQGENLITFDDDGALDSSPAFTPDGRSVLFLSNRDGATFQVYQVDVQGNAVTRVTNNDRDVQSLSFYPNSSR